MITKYHRPETLAEATALAGRSDVVIIGGGTVATTDHSLTAIEAIDLQSLPLGGIVVEGDTVRIGAMTLLQDVVESGLVPGVLADLARRDAPNTIRNAATVGGTIGTADPESQLLVGLVAFGATVTVARSGSTTDHALDDILDDPQLLSGAIITSVGVPSGGFATADRTARTPMDQPIVTAVAHRASDGSIVLAMSGVASHAVTVDPDRIDDLDPPPDFRGSSEYRSHLAAVLAERVLATVREGE
jgi:CO/xanthine dehydrogenase FAD-binding subunit